MAPPPKIAAMIWWNLISPPLTMAKQKVPIPTIRNSSGIHSVISRSCQITMKQGSSTLMPIISASDWDAGACALTQRWSSSPPMPARTHRAAIITADGAHSTT